MTWQPLYIRRLSFYGPEKSPADLELSSGLNVIWGPSNVGKSFIVEAIDGLLGASKSLPDIPERRGYDRSRLVLESPPQEIFTIERSTNGGGFRRYEGIELAFKPEQSGTTLQAKHSAGRTNNLSGYLLSSIGLFNKVVQKNKKRDTRSLSFRDLSNLVLVKEGEIIKDSSPILTGQFALKTVEFSVFKLLLTGIDDSSQVAEEEISSLEIEIKSSNAKIELINEFIQEIQLFLEENNLNKVEIENEIEKINQKILRQEAMLTQVRSELSEYQNRRREVFFDIKRLSNRVEEVNSQLARFELLQNSYQVDIERLESIEESGSFFVHLDPVDCPLCGTPPNEQHQSESCDGNVEQIVHAARGEAAKIRRLSTELSETVSELALELESLELQRRQIEPQLQNIERQIEFITTPLSEVEFSVSSLFTQLSEQQQLLEKFERLDSYRERKRVLQREIPEIDPIQETRDTNSTDLSSTLLDEFAQHVLSLLQSWNFPDAQRAYFDPSEKDLVINGQLRSSNGKGVRALTHAAITIGLMEFCQKKNLPHPGFVVLDSPLLAYKSPEEEELSKEDLALAASDVKPRFYEYLSRNLENSQVIIIENTAPPSDLGERSNVIHFTKREDIGRYGFFPVNSKSLEPPTD